jgi:ADP-heptose:LPS heptosyltransferase
VALPDDPEEHQIDTLLRLLKPLGLVKPTSFTVNLSLRVPDSARQFAAEILTGPPFDSSSPFMLMNLTSTVGLKFREEDFIELAGRILNSTNFVIGFFAALTDQQKAPEIAQCMGSPRIIALEAPGPLDLAALLEKALFLITPEGGEAHLAAAVDTPAIVLWSEGSFKKWHSRGRRNIFIDAQSEEKTIPVERVWQAIQPFLSVRQDDVEKKFADSLKLPPSSDFIS